MENTCFELVGSWISWRVLEELRAKNASAGPYGAPAKVAAGDGFPPVRT